VCILGIAGLPRNVKQLRENIRDRIKLGLDLQGGMHLVLQVHVDDAVDVTTGQVLERLREGCRVRNIPYADIGRKDTTHIVIKGIPQEKSAALQSLLNDQFSDWTLEQVAGDVSARLMSLKATAPRVLCRSRRRRWRPSRMTRSLRQWKP